VQYTTLDGGLSAACVDYVCAKLNQDATPLLVDLSDSVITYVIGGLPDGVFHPEETYSNQNQIDVIWECGQFLHAVIKNTPDDQADAKADVLERLTRVYRTASRACA
jgi:hypothetical protein